MKVARIETNGVPEWAGVISDGQALVARLKHERPDLVAEARKAIDAIPRNRSFVGEFPRLVAAFAADHIPGPTPHHTVAEFLASIYADQKETPETLAGPSEPEE